MGSKSSAELAALKLEPDFDGSPQIHPPNPPPYDSATPSKRGQADPSTMPQQKPSSETAQPSMSATPQNSTSEPSSPTAHRLRHTPYTPMTNYSLKKRRKKR
ncbi:uncharacterized protein AKAME5_001854800 [Lates japonicus]|uniref:Uncharacterized protein n=1 Tax=Lates japonicus TaxID=270547 RepID=A0AAD3RG70_LATJO|nr:uncharacterized protein AKAME5_001854800 [Lates japonicus]